MPFEGSCEHLQSLLLALDPKATHHSQHKPKRLKELGSGRGESQEVRVPWASPSLGLSAPRASAWPSPA